MPNVLLKKIARHLGFSSHDSGFSSLSDSFEHVYNNFKKEYPKFEDLTGWFKNGSQSEAIPTDLKQWLVEFYDIPNKLLELSLNGKHV